MLSRKFSGYEETVLSYIVMLVKESLSQSKAHFSDSKEWASIVVILEIFNPACDTNKIREGAAMWLLPHYVHDSFANVLKNRICAADRITPIVASVRSNDNRLSKRLRFYPEVFNYLENGFHG